MNTPTGCPKCGAKIRHQLTSIREYECRSYESGPSFVQTTICEQRDPQKLNERIAILESMVVRLVESGDKLVEAAEQVEYGSPACIEDDKLRIAVAVLQWKSAKSSTP